MSMQDSGAGISEIRNQMISQTAGAASSETFGLYHRSEYPANASSYPMNTGQCVPLYGRETAGYAGQSERYPVGYQRLGQTITLTSHKIQFGCQGDSQVAFPNQRCTETTARQQYSMLHPSLAAKPWIEPCNDRTQANMKSNNRGRTTYSEDQIAELENIFNTNPYPTSQTRQQLAYKIDVPEGKVKIWFQNRRARAKKSKLTFAGPWRANRADPSFDEQTNRNSNNGKSLNGKYNSGDPGIPIDSILPLPTKASISSGEILTSNMPTWKGYYDASNYNYSLGKQNHRPSCRFTRGPCSCDATTPDYRRASSLPAQNGNFISREQRTSALHSPPPIRRYMYPFHTLTENHIKAQHNFDSMQSNLNSCYIESVTKPEGGFSQNSSSRLHYCFGSTHPSVSMQECYQSVPSCKVSKSSGEYFALKWKSCEDDDSTNSSSSLGITESGFAHGFVQNTTDTSREHSIVVANRDGSQTEFAKAKNSAVFVDGDELPLVESDHGESAWDAHASSNIIVKAMEFTEKENRNLSPNGDQTINVNRVDSHPTNLPAIWPARFTGTMRPQASESIIG